MRPPWEQGRETIPIPAEGQRASRPSEVAPAPAAGTRSEPESAPGDSWAVVLAGGSGVRLQGFVMNILGSPRPKQFCQIIGTRSMLRHTWDRALRMVPPERVVTIITAGQEQYLEEEARQGIPGTVLVQPQNRETSPGLLFPLLWIARRDPGATVTVFPADHFIWEEERFEQHMRLAVWSAGNYSGCLTLLGVEADCPETGYGWIAPGEPIGAPAGTELHAVRRFWEKPDRHTATRLFASGHFWNTFILTGQLPTYLRLAALSVPEVLTPLRLVAEFLDGPHQMAALATAYKSMPSTNLSQALLARHPEALLLLVARGLTWSDWGDPDRIIRSLRRFDRRPAWLPVYARTVGEEV